MEGEKEGTQVIYCKPVSEIFLYYFYSIFGVVLVHRDSPWTGL